MIALKDASLMFGKWLDDKAWLLCSLRLSLCELNVVGRVAELSDTSLLFVSRRGDTKFVLRLDAADTSFWYASRRELPERDVERLPATERDLGGIGIAFPLRVTMEQVTGPLRVPERDKLIFLELPEGAVDM
jgi:hypothetical protein